MSYPSIIPQRAPQDVLKKRAETRQKACKSPSKNPLEIARYQRQSFVKKGAPDTCNTGILRKRLDFDKAVLGRRRNSTKIKSAKNPPKTTSRQAPERPQDRQKSGQNSSKKRKSGAQRTPCYRHKTHNQSQNKRQVNPTCDEKHFAGNSKKTLKEGSGKEGDQDACQIL